MNEISHDAAKLYENDEKEQAVILLAKELEKNPQQLELILQLSTYLTYGGEMEQAEELLLKSKNYFPDEPLIDYNLGNVYYNQGEYEKALAIFEQIDSNDALFMKAQCFYKLGDNNHALVYAITASENSKEEENFRLVGDILLRLGNVNEAKTYYEQAVATSKNEINTFDLALCKTVLNEADAKEYFAESKAINSQYYNDNIQKLEDVQRLINGNQ